MLSTRVERRGVPTSSNVPRHRLSDRPEDKNRRKTNAPSRSESSSRRRGVLVTDQDGDCVRAVAGKHGP